MRFVLFVVLVFLGWVAIGAGLIFWAGNYLMAASGMPYQIPFRWDTFLALMGLCVGVGMLSGGSSSHNG